MEHFCLDEVNKDILKSWWNLLLLLFYAFLPALYWPDSHYGNPKPVICCCFMYNEIFGRFDWKDTRKTARVYIWHFFPFCVWIQYCFFVKTCSFFKRCTAYLYTEYFFHVQYVNDLKNTVKPFVTAKINVKLYKINISKAPQHKILCYFQEK